MNVFFLFWKITVSLGRDALESELNLKAFKTSNTQQYSVLHLHKLKTSQILCFCVFSSVLLIVSLTGFGIKG